MINFWPIKHVEKRCKRGYLAGEYLKVVWAEFSTISYFMLLHCSVTA